MQIQISWLLQKPSDLDLHYLQRQGISGFSRTRVNIRFTNPNEVSAVKTVFVRHHGPVSSCNMTRYTFLKPLLLIVFLCIFFNLILHFNDSDNEGDKIADDFMKQERVHFKSTRSLLH